jgi:N-acetylglucosaminyldiphosphoundecaprenol N-acetyl-beta-D-mannosaminyltransferase
MKEVVLGYGVEALSIEACVESLFSTVQGADVRRCAWLACLNPHSYAVALDDPTFSRALHAADWLIPDGAGVVLASRLQGGRITERVTGSDVFFGLHRRMTAAGGMSVFFLGATEETLAAIRARMAVDHPEIRVAGTYSPPFKPEYSAEDNNAMIAAINASKADVLWVGMTAPKQEKWIFENRARLNAARPVSSACTPRRASCVAATASSASTTSTTTTTFASSTPAWPAWPGQGDFRFIEMDIADRVAMARCLPTKVSSA